MWVSKALVLSKKDIKDRGTLAFCALSSFALRLDARSCDKIRRFPSIILLVLVYVQCCYKLSYKRFDSYNACQSEGLFEK